MLIICNSSLITSNQCVIVANNMLSAAALNSIVRAYNPNIFTAHGVYRLPFLIWKGLTDRIIIPYDSSIFTTSYRILFTGNIGIITS